MEPDVAHVMWAVAGIGTVIQDMQLLPGRIRQKLGGGRGKGQLVQDPQGSRWEF